ncbi:hypothetical protein AU255_01020 [Methyloprofundus sedimenti]|uniref:Uncharacterized protein n=1 Tax=Methyloprofundus sedimenti TaxID=1420851 RepID=A0A1V8M4N6_9GAMM|nr:hypothetical protein [Methyloprofundus sedimenti]OQK16519.1 hypothetical protein AU255_01020 [Methyloprofundus sedimenti]
MMECVAQRFHIVLQAIILEFALARALYDLKDSGDTIKSGSTGVLVACYVYNDGYIFFQVMRFIL